MFVRIESLLMGAESFGLKTEWHEISRNEIAIGGGFIRNKNFHCGNIWIKGGMTRNYSEWPRVLWRIQTEWKFYSDWCGIIRIEERIHSIPFGMKIHYQSNTYGLKTSFIFTRNQSEWLRNYCRLMRTGFIVASTPNGSERRKRSQFHSETFTWVQLTLT